MNKIITQKDIAKSVVIKNGKESVRSDNLAKIFERTHKQVLALIRENLAFFKENNLSLKDFFIEEEATTKNQTYIRYYLTKKGFGLVALSLRGKQAKLYKLYYIDEFHKRGETIRKDKELAKKHALDEHWVIFREEEKVFRNKLTDIIRDTVAKYREEVEYKMNDGKYYYHYTSLIYSILGIDLPKGTNPRDVLDKRMLVRLEDMEDRVADMIKEKAESGTHYKEVYKQIKAELQK